MTTTDSSTTGAKSVTPHVFTAKIDETRAFYETHLGFRATFHQPGGYVSVQNGDHAATAIGFMAPPPGMGETATEGVMYGVEVDDVDREHARLASEGAPIVDAPEDQPWGGRRMTMRDPSGILVMLFHPIEPDEEHRQFIIE